MQQILRAEQCDSMPAKIVIEKLLRQMMTHSRDCFGGAACLGASAASACPWTHAH